LWCGITADARLLADIREEGHEARALDGGACRSLKCGAASTPLAGEDLVLVGAEFLKQADVFVVDISRSRATVSSAKAAAVLAVASKSFPRHFLEFLSSIENENVVHRVNVLPVEPAVA
jgi:hypothetical protein